MRMALSWVGRSPDLAVEGEFDDAVADRQHQEGGRTRRCSRRRLAARAGLRKACSAASGRQVGATGTSIRKDGSDGNVYVDVGGTVRGIEEQEVFALGVAVGMVWGRSISSEAMASQVAAPFVGLQQDLVGKDVQLLLGLALDVVAACLAQHAAQAALCRWRWKCALQARETTSIKSRGRR